MGIGVSTFLIAVGAILTFAVKVTVSGVSLVTVGVILMVVGAIGLLVFLAVFAPRRRATRRDGYDYPVEGGTGTTVEERRVVRDRY